MTDLLKFSVPGKPEYVRTIRMAVSSLASNLGFDVEAIDDIKVAVSEACTNVVKHGSESNISYEVSCEITEHGITISVIDLVGGYDVDSYIPPDLDHPKENGLGLLIIRALMDEVDISSKIGAGTEIRMTKYCIK